MAGTATATAPFLQYGEQAVEMERFALAAMQRPQSPDDRALTRDLLRHARGITSLVEKWRSRND